MPASTGAGKKGMKHFETREAARILDLPEERIRSCVRAGFLNPRRGPGHKYQFTFQDLVLLKTTKGLLDSGVPVRRVSRLMSSLRSQLSDDMHLSGLTIYADGQRVVVRDGTTRWEPDSGQFLFNFDVASVARQIEHPGGAASTVATLPETGAEAATTLATAPEAGARASANLGTPTETGGKTRERVRTIGGSRGEPAPGLTAVQWFDLACELEPESPQEARRAYHRALELDPTMADAHINLGRQYHETKEYEKAEAHYRAATEHASGDPVAWFNLAVLCEELKRPHEAISCYGRAIASDPEYADAHYNLGLLFDALGRRSEAMSHLMEARRLLGRNGRGE